VQSRFPDKLTVKTNALVTRVLFDADNSAVGVEYLEGAHQYRADPRAGPGADGLAARQVFVESEVILSAGAFNTPQLLKLSGVGPREELTGLGIDARVDLRGVGENLQDRYEVGVVFDVERDFDLVRNCTFLETSNDPCLAEWTRGQGPYGTNGSVASILMRSSPDRPEADLHIFGLPGTFKGYKPGYSQEGVADLHHFTWVILKGHTDNRGGTVKLRTNDPRDVPDINFRYFDEGSAGGDDDLEAVADGVEFVREVMKGSQEYMTEEILPGAGVGTRDEIKSFVRDQAWGHHASCTCAMGPPTDRMAVVDNEFRVHGTQGLRIVDASVFPRIPGFFIVTSVYMISEKASQAILDGERSGG
jgi:choline dehydrogenase